MCGMQNSPTYRNNTIAVIKGWGVGIGETLVKATHSQLEDK